MSKQNYSNFKFLSDTPVQKGDKLEKLEFGGLLKVQLITDHEKQFSKN